MTETPGIPARAAALAALSAVLRKRRPLDAALEEALAHGELAARDAGFARAIAGETLRRYGQLDALLKTFMARPPAPHRAGAAPEILLIGACELLFLETPAHAAVDAANRLAARDAKAVHFKSLINAVLRRAAKQGTDAIAAQDAARLNAPDWIWARWCGAYGEDIVRAIASVHAMTPPLDIVCKPGFAPAFENALTLPNDVRRLNHAGRVDALPGYADGQWWVQDFAATLPVRLLGEVAARTVIDLCAAPGGKTAQLAAAGAHAIAVEREPARAAQLRENLARLRLSAEIVEADMRDYAPKDLAPFVLLDAPCSATGTIRRHPELPWIKSAADVNLCADAAGELLDHAASMVAPDGTLVFAVCSLEPEEGVEQIEAFLAHHPEFARAPVAAEDVFGMTETISAEGDLRTLPCHLGEKGGMDGFYAARLRRSI